MLTCPLCAGAPSADRVDPGFGLRCPCGSLQADLDAQMDFRCWRLEMPEGRVVLSDRSLLWAVPGATCRRVEMSRESYLLHRPDFSLAAVRDLMAVADVMGS